VAAAAAAAAAGGGLVAPAGAGSAPVVVAGPPAVASVRVAVANVWAVPGRETIPADPHLWPTPAVTYSQRLGLVGHMPTQALYGERVIVLARQGAWARIVVPDQPSPFDPRGYPGWIRSSELGPRLQAGPAVTVTVRLARLADGTEVSLGTRLPLVARRDGKVLVATTGGSSTIDATAVAPLPRTRADLVRTARLFLGLRYLWGGVTAWGLDCSGLTWVTYRSHGITIPRDADAQFAAGTPTTLARARPGDLIFYGRSHVHHVTMFVGGGEMIEAPDSADSVRIVPVRTRDLAGVRSFWPSSG